MKKFNFKAVGCLLLFLYIFNLVFCGGFYTRQYTIKAAECCTGTAFIEESGAVHAFSTANGTEVGSRLWELLFGTKDKKNAPVLLCPGGGVFGLHIVEDGVTVLSGSESRVFRAGDRIIGINGVSISSGSDVETAVKSSNGRSITFDVIRDGSSITVNVTPALLNGEYKIGVKLRAETAGIGTLTYVDPETLEFGGLGHAVSDSESGAPITVKHAYVRESLLGGCKRGTAGTAGELVGILKDDVIGEIKINCECGVFGRLDEIPKYCDEPIPTAERSEIKCGEAEIISTVKNGYRERYTVEISDVNASSEGSKSFKIKVTDPALIAITGGIVRGMSGSPIIQNGKLVGAVTHVMVADPTEGYGIFIENMLNAAQNQVIPKAA